MKKPLLYAAELNRCIGDNIRRCARRLSRKGIPATVLPHKTSLLLERPPGMTWAAFKRAILSELQPRIGSVILHSEWSGITRVCCTFGNRAGDFVPVRALV